jgi:hypothetical protein
LLKGNAEHSQLISHRFDQFNSIFHGLKFAPEGASFDRILALTVPDYGSFVAEQQYSSL